ncbi:hypothetical protein C8Q73DRAFT_787301 [Cubamyces lactineus]|nr:hypothetical protein C8Q73DRAFT_787301 [Cubamyces lactineus]
MEVESALADQLWLRLPLQGYSKGAKAIQRSPLLRCTLKLLLSVFDHLKYWDVAGLSITCKDLFKLSKTTLLARLGKKYSPWAHSRLACLRDSYPLGLLISKEVVQYMHEDLSFWYEGQYRSTMVGAIREDGVHGCHSVTQARLDDERLFVFSPYYRRGVSHPSGVLVLCNESKGLYIRQDRLNVGVDYPATLPHALAVNNM